MCSDEQVRLPSFPGHGDEASGHAVRDMRAHAGPSARPGERGADRALPPDAPRSSRRRGRDEPLTGSAGAGPHLTVRWAIAAGARQVRCGYLRCGCEHDHGHPSHRAADLREPGAVNGLGEWTARHRSVDLMAADRRHRRLHAADLDRAWRPAPPARHRRRRTAGGGLRPSECRPGRAGGLDQLPGQPLGRAGLARCGPDLGRHHPRHLHGYPLDSLSGPGRAEGREPGSIRRGRPARPAGCHAGRGRPGTAGRSRRATRRVHRHRRDDRPAARRAIRCRKAAQTPVASAHPGLPRFRRHGHVLAGHTHRGEHGQVRRTDPDPGSARSPIGRSAEVSGRLGSWQKR
jgi:hypothetical protein